MEKNIEELVSKVIAACSDGNKKLVRVKVEIPGEFVYMAYNGAGGYGTGGVSKPSFTVVGGGGGGGGAFVYGEGE